MREGCLSRATAFCNDVWFFSDEKMTQCYNRIIGLQRFAMTEIDFKIIDVFPIFIGEVKMRSASEIL